MYLSVEQGMVQKNPQNRLCICCFSFHQGLLLIIHHRLYQFKKCFNSGQVNFIMFFTYNSNSGRKLCLIAYIIYVHVD